MSLSASEPLAAKRLPMTVPVSAVAKASSRAIDGSSDAEI
jgi:hypothetical protein